MNFKKFLESLNNEIGFVNDLQGNINIAPIYCDWLEENDKPK